MHILSSSNFPPLCALMNLIALFGGPIIFILLYGKDHKKLNKCELLDELQNYIESIYDK